MANLIVTIVSILLVAVVAIMAVWYGSSAFTSGSTKAKVNALVALGDQVAGAWVAYAADRGGNYALTDKIWRDGSDDLMPSYLSQMPAVPHYQGIVLSIVRQGTFIPVDVTNMASQTNDGGGGVMSTSAVAALNGLYWPLDAEMCDELLRRLGQSSPLRRSAGAGLLNVSPRNGLFDVYYNDTNPQNSAWDGFAAEGCHFIRRVF